jgi:hypothetical protein
MVTASVRQEEIGLGVIVGGVGHDLIVVVLETTHKTMIPRVDVLEC